MVNWVAGWLSQRQQRVCINGEQSTWKPVFSGVPQGSVLGPVLFLIYINDIDLRINNWLLKFADDTKIFSKISDKASSDSFQGNLTKLIQWSHNWQMEFNIQKCKVLHIGRSNPSYRYLMDSQYLEDVSDEKDLGVMFTNDLKSAAQVTEACKKANRALGMINRTIKCKSKSVLLSLYKTLVRPHLKYCTPVWSPHYAKDKQVLEKVQHRFTRMVPGMKDIPYKDRLKQLGLWTLEERRNRADLLEMFKMLIGKSTPCCDSLFERNMLSSTRGHL